MNTYTDAWPDGHGTVQHFTRIGRLAPAVSHRGSGRAGVMPHNRHTAGLLHRVHPAAVGSFTVRGGTSRHGCA